MSKVVDQRVVEMRFDNKDFESNVKTSMSTLDKLKNALKLKGVSNGLDEVGKSVKKIDMSGLASGIETVNARFSTLQVVGMTALANITTAAMQAGKNLVSSFTIDPITDGFREYELQMNSVQTILANTASKGVTINDVTAALDELNTYADKTIYNFGEMTKNIGTFTAAGVDLDKSVAAIKGIANLGAMSGSTSAQVSTAMYQLSQALATGRVSLMDWNSVVNAGMGGEQFQNALKRTAEHFGTDVDAMIKKYGSFRDSLTEGGWLTAEVLTETLNQISGAYTEADLIAQGYTKDQAAAIVQMATTAEEAATKVKTFTQLMSTLSEAAGSGWAKTWQILLGDFEEAKDFFTDLSDYFGGMIGASADARNNLLAGAFDSNFTKLSNEIEKAGVPLDTFTDKLKQVAKETYNIDLDSKIEEFGTLDKAMRNLPEAGDLVVSTLKAIAGSGDELNTSTAAMTDKLEYFQKVVDEVWKGNYKNGEERIKALTDAGYNYAEVQDLVNKTIDGQKLKLEDLNETQMKAIGFTDEQIKSVKKLAEEAEKSGTTINELIENLNKPSGRELFLDGVFNTLKAIVEPLRAIKRAFNEVFAIDSDQIYGALEAFNRFSEAILMNEDSLNKLTSTFKGIFGIFKIFTSLVGGGFGLAFNVLTTILENFDLGILDVTAAIGEVIYAITDFITFGDTFGAVMDGIIGILSNAGSGVSDLLSSIGEFPAITALVNAVGDAFNWLGEQIKWFVDSVNNLGSGASIKTIFEDIKSAFSGITWDGVLSGLSSFGQMVRDAFGEVVAAAQTIGPDIIAGLQNGLMAGAGKIFSIMQDIGSKIIEAICAVLGIHSPSTVMFEIGQNIIEGLINGLESLVDGIWSILEGITTRISEFFSGIDWGTVFVVAFSAGLLGFGYKLLNVIDSFARPFEAVGDLIDNVTDTIDDFSNSLNKMIKAKALESRANALKSFAIAIAILAGSLLVLSTIDTGSLIKATAVLVVLMGAMTAVAYAMTKFSSSSKSIKDSAKGALDVAKLAGLFVSIGASLLLFAGALKIIGSMNQGQIIQAGVVIAAFLGMVTILAGVSAIGNDAGIKNIGKMATSLGVSFLLLSAALAIIGGMDESALQKATSVIQGFVALIGLLTVTSYFAGYGLESVGKLATKLGLAMLALTASFVVLGNMDESSLEKATSVVKGFVVLIGALMVVSSLTGGGLDKVGDSILQIAGAVAILAIACRIIGGMDVGALAKAVIAVGLLGAIVAGLAKATSKAGGNDLKGVGVTLLAMSAAIGILAGAAVLLGMVKIENLAKGIVAVGMLSAMMVAMTKATKGASDVKGTMMGIAVAIGVLAAAVAVLSFIDSSALLKSVAALSAVMGMLSVVINSASKIKAGGMGTIIALTASLATMTAALVILSGLPIENLIASSTALSTLLLSLAGACKILASVQKISPTAIVGVSALTAIAAGLALVLAAMSGLNVQNGMANAAALSVLLISMSAACAILGTIKEVSTSAIVGMTALTGIMAGLALILAAMSGLNVQTSSSNVAALSTLLIAMSGACVILSTIKTISAPALAGMLAMTGIVAALALVLAAMNGLQIDMSLETAASLSLLLVTMSGVMVVLSAIGPIATGAIAAAGSMAAVIAIIAGIVAAAGAIKQIPGAQWLVDEGAAFLSSIGSAIGGFVGSIVGGALEGISSSLPQIGTNLSVFMTNLKPFLEGASTLNPESATAVKTLIESLGSLITTGALNSLVSFFTGGTSLTDFADQLVPFGEAMQKYSNAVSGIDVEAVTASAQAAEALGKLANSLPKEGGLAQAIFGESGDLGNFAGQLVNFGTALQQYSASVTGLDVEAITASATAGEALSKLASTLPKEGGLAQAIFGESGDLGNFGTQLAMFGLALKMYATSVTGLDVEAIQASIPAGQALADLASALPKEEGWIGKIFGGQSDLGSFGTQLSQFGNALSSYSTSLAGVDFAMINSATTSVKKVVQLATSLADSGGDIDSGVANAKKIKGIGDALSNYSTSISGVDTGKLASSTSSIKTLVNTIQDMAGMDTSGVATFKTAIEDLSSISFDTLVSNFTTAAQQLSTVGLQMMTNLANGIESGTGYVIGATQSVIIQIAQTVSVSFPAFETGGETIGESLAEGISNTSSASSSAIRVVLASALSAANDYHRRFYNTGAYLSQGLASGMRSALSSVRSAAAEMSRLAAQAAAAAAKVNSPSRVFHEIGAYMGEGMVNGLEDYQPISRKAGAALAETAATGLRRAIGKVTDVLDSAMDTTPVITPVLDLSDVQNGALALNSMLTSSVPVDVLGEVGSINRAMNARNQNNSTFDDVVYSIDRLRRDLQDLPRNTYSVGGITYDDGTAIANAVESLIRATRIEGRV